jgi:hypothetical protein
LFVVATQWMAEAEDDVIPENESAVDAMIASKPMQS